MHLIVVDSTPAQRELLSAAGRDCGISLGFVDDGAAASPLAVAMPGRPAASADEPMALLLNCAAQQGDALALLRALRNDDHYAALSVALITPVQPGPALEQLIEAGLDLGARYFIADSGDDDAMRELLAALREDAPAAAPPTSDAGHGWRRLRGAWFVLRQVDEVQPLSALIAATTAQPERAAFGIAELLLNGIEHGNLGLSYEEKKQLRLYGGWSDEIRRRAGLAENRDKRVRVSVRRAAAQVSIRVSDDGSGFDWRHYLTLDARRACDPNGRGIAMARLTSFTDIDYLGDGNVALATIADPLTAEELAA